MLHADPKVNDELIAKLRQKYDSSAGKMKVVRGKLHEYLGIKFDYGTKKVVKIEMKDYIKKMLQEFPDTLNNKCNTPAKEWLFKVRENNFEILLDENKAEDFHTQVAKMLFLCKRARPDIQTEVEFLETRVKQPNEDDWKKLTRVAGYLKQTKNLKLTLGTRDEGLKISKWYMDGAHQVN